MHQKRWVGASFRVVRRGSDAMNPRSLDDAAVAGNAVALARGLVAIPSVNPDLEAGGAAEGEIGAVCAGLLEHWGLDVSVDEVAPGRVNVLGRLKGSGPTLLLNGHLDTVGVNGMSIDPFGAEIRDGRLWGRGACDMKGGVAALLAATHALMRHEESRPNIIVALTADEENASIGMARLVEGGIRADYAVVCEPTELAVMPAHKGFLWLEARFRGHAAHGSRPDVGVDAIRHAALYLASLEDHARSLARKAPHPLLGHGSFHAGTIRGGAGLSVYPEACTLTLERRTLPDESAPDVVRPFRAALERLTKADPTVRAELEVTLERPGTEVPGHSTLVRGLLEAIQTTEVAARVEGMTAWVDAAYLNRAGIPAVCFGPGSIAQAHTADEWIDVDQIASCANVLTAFARSLVTRTAAD